MQDLLIEDLVIGQGEIARSGMTVRVHYTGWLTDGIEFDSSLGRNKPFEFSLGASMVIAGWDQGIENMQVGGKRKLTISPELGYGQMGGANGIIPPNATLIFDIELLAII